jgi:hypothetical protein
MLISETAHEFLDTLDNHDLKALAAFLPDDVRVQTGDALALNKSTFLGLLYAYFAGFSNFDFNFSEADQADDTLRVKYAITGTHDRVFDLEKAGLDVQVEPTGTVLLLPASTLEAVFDVNGQVKALTLHPAPGATLNDVLRLLGADAPARG